MLSHCCILFLGANTSLLIPAKCANFYLQIIWEKNSHQTQSPFFESFWFIIFFSKSSYSNKLLMLLWLPLPPCQIHLADIPQEHRSDDDSSHSKPLLLQSPPPTPPPPAGTHSPPAWPFFKSPRSTFSFWDSAAFSCLWALAPGILQPGRHFSPYPTVRNCPPILEDPVHIIPSPDPRVSKSGL